MTSATPKTPAKPHQARGSRRRPLGENETPPATPGETADGPSEREREEVQTLKASLSRDPRAFAERFFKATHCRHPFSALHDYLFSRRVAKIARPLPDREGILDVILAPRGAAKSTLVSLIFPLHAMLYGHEHYIVLVSATQQQANGRLASLRNVLLQNEELHKIYGEELARLARNSAHSLILGDARIDAFSARSEMRGISFGPWRPTWIILDDAERSDRVRKAEQRDALADWFAETVDNLGDRYTHIDVIGTLLHRDALPARLARRPDAVARTWRSIESEATNLALWEQWRAIFNDLADKDRVATAWRFFKKNEPAMLEGSRVLWPEKESYYDLMKNRETRGHAAFDKEKQNEPWAEGNALFAAFPLRRFRLEGGLLVCDPFFTGSAVSPVENGAPEVPLARLRVFGFLDPALGGPGGDFAAIATVGRDDAGYLYLLDVWLAHAGPTAQVQRLFDLHERWNYEKFGIEANTFQRLLLDPIETERRRRQAQGRPATLPVDQFQHPGDKSTRILTLEPLARNGWLLLNAELPGEFMAQLLDFPNARHDDGPDALAAAVKLARDSVQTVLQAQRRPRSTALTKALF